MNNIVRRFGNSFLNTSVINSVIGRLEFENLNYQEIAVICFLRFEWPPCNFNWILDRFTILEIFLSHFQLQVVVGFKKMMKRSGDDLNFRRIRGDFPVFGLLKQRVNAWPVGFMSTQEHMRAWELKYAIMHKRNSSSVGPYSASLPPWVTL